MMRLPHHGPKLIYGPPNRVTAASAVVPRSPTHCQSGSMISATDAPVGREQLLLRMQNNAQSANAVLTATPAKTTIEAGYSRKSRVALASIPTYGEASQAHKSRRLRIGSFWAPRNIAAQKIAVWSTPAPAMATQTSVRG